MSYTHFASGGNPTLECATVESYQACKKLTEYRVFERSYSQQEGYMLIVLLEDSCLHNSFFKYQSGWLGYHSIVGYWNHFPL